MNKIDIEKYVEWVKTRCNSVYEGCLCTRPKNHSGLHVCEAKDTKSHICGCTWTDEEEKEFMDELKNIYGP
jgi:hypothetical protein